MQNICPVARDTQRYYNDEEIAQAEAWASERRQGELMRLLEAPSDNQEQLIRDRFLEELLDKVYQDISLNNQYFDFLSQALLDPAINGGLCFDGLKKLVNDQINNWSERGDYE